MKKIRKSQQKGIGLTNQGFQGNFNLQVIILVMYVFILYGNTMLNEYSLDDRFVVLDHKLVEKGIRGIPEIFTSRYVDSETDNKVSTGYRPVVVSTFAIEYQFFGYAPGFSHFINVVLYALAGILLLIILKRIFKDFHVLFPLVIAALFIAHPVHTEVVASLKNRDELIVLSGSLFSMYLFLKYADFGKVKYLFSGLFFFILACFSKATALPYIFLIPLVLYFFTPLRLSKIFMISAGLILVFIVVTYLPQLYLPKGFRPRIYYENNIRFEDFFTRLTTGFYILFFYLKKLIIPFPLLYYYGYNMIPIAGIGNIWVILSILFHGGIFVFAIYKIREKHIFSFIIMFYLIALAPFTNVIRPVMGIVGERFLLTPSIAFSMFLGLLIFLLFNIGPAQINPGRPALKRTGLVVFILLIPFSAITINRNTQWKDHLTLYHSDMKYLENSVKGNELYATVLLNNLESGKINPNEKEETIKKIIAHYTQALKLYPDYDKIWNNIAILYSKLNKLDESIQFHKKAVELKPKINLYRLNLGARYHQIKEYDEAIECWKKCIEIDSTYNEARAFLSIAYIEQKEYEQAIKVNKEFLRIDSLSDKPYENLGFIYLQTGDTTLAIQNWETAVSKNPKNVNVCRMLNKYFTDTNNQAKAGYYSNLANAAGNKN